MRHSWRGSRSVAACLRIAIGAGDAATVVQVLELPDDGLQLAGDGLLLALDRDALDGPGAFGRFRDTLSGNPNEFTRWHRFAGDRQRGRARARLADHGYQPHPTPTRNVAA